MARTAPGMGRTGRFFATDHFGIAADCYLLSKSLGGGLTKIGALLVRAGYEPVFQMACRDRNRIALQGDLLGAAAMGVTNVLCITGDDVSETVERLERVGAPILGMVLNRADRVTKGGYAYGGYLQNKPPAAMGNGTAPAPGVTVDEPTATTADV